MGTALQGGLLKDPATGAWGFAPDGRSDEQAEQRLQDPTLEKMLLRIEEMQVSAALHHPDNTVSQEKVTRDRAGI